MLAVESTLPLERFDTRPRGKKGFRTGASLVSAKQTNLKKVVAYEDVSIDENGYMNFKRFDANKQKKWEELEAPSKVKTKILDATDLDSWNPELPKEVTEKAKKLRYKRDEEEDEENTEKKFKLVKTKSGTTLVPIRPKGKGGVRKTQERAAKTSNKEATDTDSENEDEEEHVEVRLVYQNKNPKEQVLKNRRSGDHEYRSQKEARGKSKKELLIMNTFV